MIKEVELENFAKTMALAVGEAMQRYGKIQLNKNIIVGLKDAIYKDIVEINSIEKSAKLFDELIK